MDSPLERDRSVDTVHFNAVECHNVLGNDAFQNERSRELFDAINELKGCGASTDVDLPEIVVVGDQSVGKSALLQSLTEIPFPQGESLCTRFPTRLVSRKDKYEHTKVSIEPCLFSTLGFTLEPMEQLLARRALYSEFEQEYTRFSAADFASVVAKALQIMQIGDSASRDAGVGSQDLPKRNFSEDVLKIEVSGPNRSHFAILDIPGNFQSLTGNLTKDDMRGVKEMVQRHIGHRQSLIVCVASGPTDLANQAVFDMASDKDKTGDRTVGVITKCDVTQQPSQIIEIVKNKMKPFRHGWFVVRNRTPSEVKHQITTFDHHKREQDFFSSEPWNTIPEERRGTQALKKQLAKLLSSRIEQVFPTLIKDVEKLQAATKTTLESLGTSRETLSQKRAYLSDIALAFHCSILQGLQGQYASLTDDAMKLRMKVREANDTFALVVKQNGHTVPFMEQVRDADASEIDGGNGISSTFPPGAKSAGHFGQIETGRVRLSCPCTKQGFIPFIEIFSPNENHFQSINSDGKFRNFSFEELRLSDYLQAQAKPVTASQPFASSASAGASPFNTTSATTGGGLFGSHAPTADGPSASSLFTKPVPTQNSGLTGPFLFGMPVSNTNSSSEIYRWIRNEIKASRGTELQGTLNPSVLPILFHKQAKPWKALSENHFWSVRAAADSAVRIVLQTVCKDQGVRQRIETSIREASIREGERRSEQLVEHVENLLTKHLQTSNEAFAEKVKSARMTRFHAALERYRKSHQHQEDGRFGYGNRLEVDMRDTAALFSELHMSNQQNLEDEIHDILKAYYEIARESFVEFVNSHIVEEYLYGKEGPVFFFSPVYVGALADQEVENLAAEDENLVRQRAEKEATLLRLSRAHKIAERCLRSK